MISGLAKYAINKYTNSVKIKLYFTKLINVHSAHLKLKIQTNLIKQAIDLALISQNLLKGKDLTNFVKRSVEMIK